MRCMQRPFDRFLKLTADSAAPKAADAVFLFMCEV